MHGALPSPPLRFPTSSGYFVLDVNMANSSWTRQDGEPVPQYDQRGRLQPFVETAEQRRVRQEFLRKRGLSKRISAWLEESEQSHIVPEVSTSQRPSLVPSRSSSSSSLRTIDEEEEPEPEIFYSTAPATPSASSWWALPPSFLGNGASLSSRFGPRARHTRTSSFSSRSTSSSLSSISESEED